MGGAVRRHPRHDARHQDGDKPGVLRIDFPSGAGVDGLESVSRGEWFHKFGAENLPFLYQESKASGADSTFFELARK